MQGRQRVLLRHCAKVTVGVDSSMIPSYALKFSLKGNYIMKRVAFSFLLAMVCGVLQAQTQQPPLMINVETMKDQPLPIRVQSAHLQNFMYTSQLTVDIALEKDTTPIYADFLLVIYHDGKVIEGEGWRETTLTRSITHDAKFPVKEGDHAMVVVTTVSTNLRTLKLNETELGNRIHEYIEGKNSQPLPVEVTMKNDDHPKIVRCQGTCSF